MTRIDTDIIGLQRRAHETPQPGSLEEAEALAAIDQARFEEMYPQSKRRQRARMRRHWSDREHALGN